MKNDIFLLKDNLNTIVHALADASSLNYKADYLNWHSACVCPYYTSELLKIDHLEIVGDRAVATTELGVFKVAKGIIATTEKYKALLLGRSEAW